MSKGFDPIGRISDLESALSKATQRIAELEYLLEKLNEHKDKGTAAPAASAAELRSLLDENVKLKSELSKANQTKGKTDKLLFSMSREHAAASARMGKRAASSITIKRLNYRLHETQILQEEVVRWLNGLLAPPAGTALAAALTPATLMDTLSTGSVLCALIRRIKPALSTVMGRVHEKAAAGSFLCHDNVKAFFAGCTALGVPAHDLFETNDLVGANKNPRVVVHCILSLAKAAAKEGIPPPEIVRIDMEIDEMKRDPNAGAGAAAADAKAAAEAKEREAARAKEEAEVTKVLAELCKSFAIPLPKKQRGLLYTFADAAQTTAYVRMLRGTALIRLKDGWEELTTFLSQIAQTAPADSAEEKEVRKRIEDATVQLRGQLSNMTAHRDAIAAQLVEVQTQLSVSVKDAGAAAGAAAGAVRSGSVAEKEAETARAAEFDARVKAEVARATADLKEQILRAIDERDRARHAAGPEMAALKAQLAAAQAERDDLTGKLIDANAKAAASSSASASEADKTAAAAKSLAEVKSQLLSALKERDALAVDRADLSSKLKAFEAKLTALQDDLSKAEEAAGKAGGGKSKKSVGFSGAADAKRSAGIDEESDEEESAEKRKAREDEAAQKEFFFLTALAVKMNHQALGDAFEMLATASANSSDLYEKARAQEIPFHQFHKWIERELTMAYLIASHTARAEMGAAHHKDLRSLRAARQTVIKNRPHASPTVVDASQS